VIIACRSSIRGGDAVCKLRANTTNEGEGEVKLMHCDLSSLASVRAFARLFVNEEERLDVLICNAGIGYSPVTLTDDGFDPVVQSNYLAHVLLTDLLIDKLQQCRPSRIINVSSDLHQRVTNDRLCAHRPRPLSSFQWLLRSSPGQTCSSASRRRARH
jgi:NAD(P)-dependent dehydrogenase (short-subunit alcohol dehydrogenase family)